MLSLLYIYMGLILISFANFTIELPGMLLDRWITNLITWNHIHVIAQRQFGFWSKWYLIYPPIFFYFLWAIWRYFEYFIYLRIRISVIQKPRRICYPSRWLCTKLDSTKSAVPLCHWCLKNPLIFLISVFDKFLFYADKEIAFNWLSVAWHSDFPLDSSSNSTRYIP